MIYCGFVTASSLLFLPAMPNVPYCLAYHYDKKVSFVHCNCLCVCVIVCVSVCVIVCVTASVRVGVCGCC